MNGIAPIEVARPLFRKEVVHAALWLCLLGVLMSLPAKTGGAHFWWVPAAAGIAGASVLLVLEYVAD